MSMKVLIVDDELLVRIRMRHFIESHKEYVVCGEAENGVAAMQQIGQERPSIVLLDLSMPVMDGLHVIKELKKISFRPKIIVLSCHDEFSIVKEALLNGADNYLLKNTLTEESLLSAMNDVRRDIMENQADSSRMEEVKAAGPYHDKLLRSMLHHSVIKKELMDLIDIKSKNCCCIAFSVLNYSTVKARYEHNDFSIFTESLLAIINNALQDHREKELFINQENQYILLLSFSDKNSQMKIIDSIKVMLEKIHTLASMYLNVSLKFGIGSIRSSYGELSESYRESVKAMDLYFYSFNQYMIFYCNSVSTEFSEETFTQLSFRIYSYALHKRYDELKVVLQEMMNVTRKSIAFNYPRPYKVITLYMDIVKAIVVGEQLSENEIFEKLAECETIGQLDSLFWDFFQLHQLDNMKNLDPVIQNALRFIGEHYKEDLSIAILADRLQVSESYLGRASVVRLAAEYLNILIITGLLWLRNY